MAYTLYTSRTHRRMCTPGCCSRASFKDHLRPLRSSRHSYTTYFKSFRFSPHGIAGPQNHEFTTFGEKCPLARLVTIQNFVVLAIQQEMSEISAIENLCFPKKWAKIHQNRLRPALRFFYTLQYFGFPKGPPWSKGHRSG